MYKPVMLHNLLSDAGLTRKHHTTQLKEIFFRLTKLCDASTKREKFYKYMFKENVHISKPSFLFLLEYAEN